MSCDWNKSGFSISLLIDTENGTKTPRRKGRRGIPGADIAAVYNLDSGRHMFKIIPLFEDTHHDIHGDARLQYRQVAGRGGDVTPADAAMHTRTVVIRENFDPVCQPASSQDFYGSFRCNGRACDAVKIVGIAVKSSLDQLSLD